MTSPTPLTNHQTTALDELQTLLRFPSVSTDPAHSKDVYACAEWLRVHLTQIGLEHVQLYPTPGNPIVYADWLHAPGKPTVLVYGHYDVQPADPLQLWESSPFEPSIRDGYVYARGAADDKGQFFCHIKSIEQLLRYYGTLPVNVKIILEGEEEIGSPNLVPFIERNQALLQADTVLISDTTMFAPGVPALCFSLRGIVCLEVTVQAAQHDLHSGSYGGVAPNPINALAALIAKLRDERGHVLIPHFYDDVVQFDPALVAAVRALPDTATSYKNELAVPTLLGEPGYSLHEQLWMRPTLDCNGIVGGYTGAGSKTVIPSHASTKISMRLVPNQDPATITRLATEYIMASAPPGVTVSVAHQGSGAPCLLNRDSAATRAAHTALTHAFGREPVWQGEGGSIPIIADFQRVLHAEVVLLGFGLDDDRIHAPNERFLLDNFFRGIHASQHFLTTYGKEKGVNVDAQASSHVHAE